MLSDCIYDYGDSPYITEKVEISKFLTFLIAIVSFLKSIMSDPDRNHSILFTYFISEILYWLSHDSKDRGNLVQAGILLL